MTTKLTIAATLLISTAAIAEQTPLPPMPWGYEEAGPEPTDVLPTLARWLSTNLIDPASATGLQLCPPRRVDAVAPSGGYYRWQPASWAVDFRLNSKNRLGGYTGLSDATAWFRFGAIDQAAFHRLDKSLLGLNGRTLAAERMGITCRRVPDSELQALISNS